MCRYAFVLHSHMLATCVKISACLFLLDHLSAETPNLAAVALVLYKT